MFSIKGIICDLVIFIAGVLIFIIIFWRDIIEVKKVSGDQVDRIFKILDEGE